jgi:hypothetical protein
MATSFKNKVESAVGTSPVKIYEAPVGINTTIIGLSLSNITAGIITASVFVQDDTSAQAYFLKNVQIAPASSLRVVTSGEKLVIPANDDLFVESNTAAAVDVVMSYVEIS